jgi:hypothetical protein
MAGGTMNRVIILATGWTEDYWGAEKEAQYPKTRYTELPDWEELSKHCPLAGLGVYITQKGKDLRSGNLGNEEFEDRVANLLTALGFNVRQKGYKSRGEYPDGIAFLDDQYSVVYDCQKYFRV